MPGAGVVHHIISRQRLLEIDIVTNRVYASLGADIIGVTAWCPGDAQRADQRTARFNDYASANNHHAGQIAHTCLHHARLTDGVKLSCVGAKCRRRPCLTGGSRWGMRTSKTVPQHDLSNAEAIDNRNRYLIAASLAVRERGTGEIERKLWA